MGPHTSMCTSSKGWLGLVPFTLKDLLVILPLEKILNGNRHILKFSKRGINFVIITKYHLVNNCILSYKIKKVVFKIKVNFCLWFTQAIISCIITCINSNKEYFKIIRRPIIEKLDSREKLW